MFPGRLRFERFVSDVGALLLNAGPDELDGATAASLADLRDFIGADRGGIAELSEDGQALNLTYPFGPRGAAAAVFEAGLARTGSWYAAEIRAGRPVVLSHLPEDLPEPERGGWEPPLAVGLQSHISVPLRVGDEVLGALVVEDWSDQRDWPSDILARLELLASLYAHALYRRRVRARQQRADDLNQSVLSSIASEIVVLDARGRIVAVNEAWKHSPRREQLPGELVSPGSDYLAIGERAMAQGLVETNQSLDGIRAVLSGESPGFQATYDYMPQGGQHRNYSVTVLPRASGAGVVIVQTDVTELEEARAELERSLEEAQALQERLEAENVVLHEQVHRAQGFDHIVGTSSALGHVHEQVEQVAATDAPVLLLGETGTGKELVARALHERSRRARRPLVTVNCAALPPTLVESEVFGYEKGAFTGALKRSVGRFEAADGGTLFLDEIGELPLDVQAKLLRVLQTGQFERLGSTKTVQVDVRLVTATNRDLDSAVREGRFRDDLYYRLNVFPISLPPLRERREDIPLLVWHFIERRQGRLGRSIKTVPDRVMEAFTTHDWPGNVRELENMVERALIRSRGDTLAADPALLETAPTVPSARPAPGPDASLARVERAHIVAVLEECGWKVAGKGGAAERLGLKRSTLQSRMNKLGIPRAPGRP